jgi:hypothetical protein
MAAAAAACGDDSPSASPPTTFPPDFTAEDCLVTLHGRSGDGAVPTHHADWAELAPGGNEAWAGGGRVWRYDTAEAMEEASGIVEEVVDAAGCERVAIHGFSNGAAFAGALACSGDTLGGRLVGVVVDDPVPDDSSPECAPDPDVAIAVYWTGGLAEAEPGASCEDLGWTCAGGDRLVGIDAYAERLGAPVQRSPHRDHRAHRDAPEIAEWLRTDV